MRHWVCRTARMHPHRPAIISAAGPITYRALEQQARSVAASLRQRGIGPGDRVALPLSGDELVIALHGCLLAGAAAVPIDGRLGPAERAPRLAGAALVIEGLVDVTSAPTAIEDLDLDAVATVMYTSGTTAAPKEVLLTAGNWLWNAIGSATALGLDPGERWLCPMPLAHVGGLSIVLRSAIYGTTVVVHERFDTSAVRDALMDRAAGLTLVSLVPTMLSRLLDAGLSRPPTLRRVLLGGGPIPEALLDRATAAGVPVSPSFGMTETCSQIATDGYPVLGADLTLGADGELLVRGPSVAASALAADGWLHTGDLAAFDDRGRLQIIGRLADTIVSGGENVAPAEVEAVLGAHPDVADAAVLGRADPEWGEAVVAQVVVRGAADVDPAALAAQLRAHCAAQLAPFKIPKAFEVVAALPRSATGKLQRRELR